MRKTTILLGAGAMIPFGGPTTKDLTDLLNENEICKNIFQYLQKNYTDNCNFETLLTTLEILFEYNVGERKRYEQSIQKTSINNAVFQLKRVLRHYKLEDIWEVYKCSINKIIAKVIEYDNQIKINTNINHHKNLYEILLNESENNWLKIYSLNYDRLIPHLFHESEIYEGVTNQRFDFDLNNFIDHNITHFNLHGSIYVDYGKGYDLHLTNAPVKIEESYSLYGGNPTEKKVFLPIIAGYHKTQRTMSGPFNFGFTAFSYDCNTCDKLVLIGYSFGDPHINSIIRNYVKKGKTRILIIDLHESESEPFKLDYKISETFDFITTFNSNKDPQLDKTNGIGLYLKGFDNYILEYNSFII